MLPPKNEIDTTSARGELILLALISSPTLRTQVLALPNFAIRISEPVFEPPERVVAFVADLHPALILVEFGPEEQRSARWLSFLRSDPATRRIPALAVGSGERAERRAASLKMPLIAVENLRAESLAQYLIAPATETLSTECERPLPPLVRKGLEEFNAGEYFECHETLEHAWNEEAGPVREVYRAILQIGVAYLQIQRGNYAGARKMFLRSVQWFAPLPDRCQGIDIAQLRADAAAVRAHLETLGPERIGEFDRSLLKPIRYAAE